MSLDIIATVSLYIIAVSNQHTISQYCNNAVLSDGVGCSEERGDSMLIGLEY